MLKTQSVSKSCWYSWVAELLNHF